MDNKKKQKRIRAKLVCWFMTAMMLAGSAEVSAASFSAGESAQEMFSSGEDTGSVSAQTDTGSVEVFSDAASSDSTAEVPAEDTENDAGLSDSDTEVFSAEEEETLLGAGTELQVGDPVRVTFADNSGNPYGSDMDIITKMGESFVLPQVPDSQGLEGSGWKLALDTPDEDAIVLEAGEEFSLSPDEDIDNYIIDGVLTLYAVQGERLYTVNFYNNSGTALFSGGQMKVTKGTTIIMPDYPNSKYVNFGWTTTKGGRTVEYEFGEKYTVSGNMDFYIIRYATSSTATVNFTNPSGQQNSTFKALTAVVVKGNSIKLPSVPAVSGYTALGWSTKKNATTPMYLAGRTLTIKKDTTLYAVRKKVATYTVTFNNNSGTSTSSAYKKLNQKVARNSYLILPDLPDATGYVNLGWTTTKNGKKPLYKEGARVKITKNTKFYTVRRKSNYYTVTFYLGNGGSNSTYKSLQMRVEEGTKITLPSVPDRDGYVNLGWTTTKNGTSVTNRAGTKYSVTKNTAFYAVQSKEVTVTLHYNTGAIYRTVQVGEGDSLELPGMTANPPYTMMGWSTVPNQTASPQYEVGETIEVDQAMHLYAVIFNRNYEPDISADNLSQADLRRYEQIIFVGDSRTHRMESTLLNQFGTLLTQGVTFISQEGGGLSWLQSTGYTQLMQAVGNSSSGILAKPTVVIFNLGVNDLGSSSSYISYMKELGEELEEKGCILYYMSVNPVNDRLIQASGKPSRPEASVRSFNAAIKSGLCSSGLYTYIDTYTYLMNTGYGTDASTTGVDSGIDDGLHYTTKTYKRIYQYCMELLNSV